MRIFVLVFNACKQFSLITVDNFVFFFLSLVCTRCVIKNNN